MKNKVVKSNLVFMFWFAYFQDLKSHGFSSPNKYLCELIPSHTQSSQFGGGNSCRKSWNSLVQNHRT